MPESTIRLVAFDLDGTTLNTKKELTPAVIEAIQAAIQAGVHMVPTTGRSYSAVPEELLEIEGISHLIASNGAVIYEMPDKILRAEYMPKDVARKALRIQREIGGATSLMMEDGVFAAHHDAELYEKTLDENHWKYFRGSRAFVDDLEAIIDRPDFHVEKLTSIYPDAETMQKACDLLHEAGNMMITSSMRNNLEVGRAGTTKGSGLLWLAQRLGVPMAQVLAVGDNDNDIPMLQVAGIGVAVGNANEATRAAADRLAPGCDEDGLAHVLRSIL